MRHLVLFVLALSSLPAFSQIVGNPYSSLCQFSYRSDSYGRGIESAFTGEDLRSRYHDESCYQLGLETGLKAIEDFGRQSCKREFIDAYPQGFSASLMSAGVHCYNLGYSSGLAALGVGAREGDVSRVGEACVKAYQKGRKDGKAGRVSSPETTDQPELHCYQLGHFEYSLF